MPSSLLISHFFKIFFGVQFFCYGETYTKRPMDTAKKEWVMYSEHDISVLKKMTITEYKVETMRQLKASYDQAKRNGTLRTRHVTSQKTER